VSFILFFLFSNVQVIDYSTQTWLEALVGPMIFLLQPQTFGVLYGYLGLIELEIYLCGELNPTVTLGPLWYVF
jgi:hypothetical protein